MGRSTSAGIAERITSARPPPLPPLLLPLCLCFRPGSLYSSINQDGHVRLPPQEAPLRLQHFLRCGQQRGNRRQGIHRRRRAPLPGPRMEPQGRKRCRCPQGSPRHLGRSSSSRHRRMVYSVEERLLRTVAAQVQGFNLRSARHLRMDRENSPVMLTRSFSTSISYRTTSTQPVTTSSEDPNSEVIAQLQQREDMQRQQPSSFYLS